MAIHQATVTATAITLTEENLAHLQGEIALLLPQDTTYGEHQICQEAMKKWYTDVLCDYICRRWQDRTPQTDAEWHEYQLAVRDANEEVRDFFRYVLRNLALYPQHGPLNESPLERFLFLTSADVPVPWEARRAMAAVGIAEGDLTTIGARYVPYDTAPESPCLEEHASQNSRHNHTVEVASRGRARRRAQNGGPSGGAGRSH